MVHSLSKGSVGPVVFDCSVLMLTLCVCVRVFQGSCRGTRPDLNLFLLSQDLQCPPITFLGAQCILGWGPTPRAACRALTGLKDPSMDTKVRVVCLNGNHFTQLSSRLSWGTGLLSSRPRAPTGLQAGSTAAVSSCHPGSGLP